MADNDVVIKVRVEDEGTARFFNDLGEEIGTIDTATDEAAGGFTRLEARLVTLNSVVGLAQTAFNVLSGAFSSAFGAISQGANIDDISSSFENLAKQAGASGDALLGKLNTALSNTIPNVQLMQQANELLIGGLKPEEIESVAIAARAFGEATGTDAAQGMNALADSLLRGNDRALKTLGIVVDNKQAEIEYAATLGKTREQLSEQERVLATREATLAALSKESARLGTVTDDAGDKIAQMSTALTNAKDRFLQTLSQNKALNEALGTLSEILRTIDFSAIINGLASVAAFAAEAISWLVKFANQVAQFAQGTDPMTVALGRTTVKFEEFDNKLISIIDLLGKGTKQATAQAISDYNKLGAQFKEQSANGTLLHKTIVALNPEFHKAGLEVAAAAKQFGLMSDKEAPQLTEELKKLAETSKVVVAESSKIGPAISKSVTEASAAAKANPVVIPISIGGGPEGVEGAFKDIAEMIAGGGAGGGSGLNFGDQLLSDLFGEDNLGLSSGIADTISSALADGITNGFDREDIGKTLSAVGKDFTAQWGLSFLDPFIDIGGDLVNDAIESIFGGEHAGTTARKAADKFFADAFEANRLSVIINGELKQIEDLVFKGDTLFGGNSQFTDGSFDNFFAGLPQAAQEAFGGVGMAFEELLGVSEDISGQIGAVLANNIGGSLNNLQLLVEASGKSFEELKGVVVEAFLDGKISALEAQTALNGIAQAAQKGIPDGIGMTIQAFQNLKDAGSKGGRAVIDALKDIGFEAQELNITTLPALMAQLAASGQFTAQEIDQVFAALSAQGIDSIEELTNATNEQLIGALSQLEAQEFPFAAAVDDASELVDTLDRLPSEKNLTINIKTNLDSNTKEAINSGALSELRVAGSPTSLPS